MTEAFVPRHEFDTLRQDFKELSAEFKNYRHSVRDQMQEVFGKQDRMDVDFTYIKSMLTTISGDVRILMSGSSRAGGAWGLLERIVPWIAIAGTVWVGLR